MTRRAQIGRAGFTLVEIMIVVAIIGLLAMIAVPSFRRASMRAQNARYANDVRVASSAFEQFAIENGDYPPDNTPGNIPPGMDDYLEKMKWEEETALGGQWDWDYDVFGVVAGVSVKSPSVDENQLRMLDEVIDDGNLQDGAFRERSGGYIFVIEE